MTWLRHLASIAMVSCSVTLCVAQSKTTTFVLGVAHASPLLAIEPFARFTGSVWLNTWPPADESGKPAPPLERVPIAWLSKPVPRTWTLWPRVGAPLKATVTKITREEGGCTAPLVLVLQSTPPLDIAFADDNAPPILAVDTAQPIEAVRALPSTDADWTRLAPVVVEAFRRNEARLVANPAMRELVASARREIDFSRLEIEVTSLVRPARESDPFRYYFEAQKQTTLRNGMLFGIKARGWLLQNGTDWTAVGVSGGPFDEEGMSSTTPLGIVRVEGRVFWVAMLVHYESSEFVIDEILPQGSRRLLRAGGSGC